MQILHFDWLRYKGTISNGHRVAKFASFSFLLSPNNFFFQLAFVNCIIAFSVRLVVRLVILKQLDPSPSRGTGQ